MIYILKGENTTMKKSTIATNREFMFTCIEDAKATLRQAIEIAKIYGYVTVADICDFNGMAPIYTENLVGWSLDAIKKAEICEYYYDDGQGNMYSYVLCLPQCDWERYCHTKEDEKTPSTGEPINITISSGEWDTRRNDIEQVFNELFRNSDKTKDRPVFINIM